WAARCVQRSRRGGRGAIRAVAALSGAASELLGGPGALPRGDPGRRGQIRRADGGNERGEGYLQHSRCGAVAGSTSPAGPLRYHAFGSALAMMIRSLSVLM